ncbi:hypothetical protein KIW84_035795 [Lathyrus oleraceus]|uniref:Uncharacterized protein n=1 Tax=Pisum sativum TaxID=3888 RepID=A0A9D4Y3N6_PEA|nr:hypothetical protein KIW84_035795 [Pisum sativum]
MMNHDECLFLGQVGDTQGSGKKWKKSPRGESESCMFTIIVPRFNLPESVVIAYDGQKSVVSLLVIRLAGHTPYESDKVVPYKYNATMVEDDKEVPIHAFSFVVNIIDVSGVSEMVGYLLM